jgi:hypothetical protein
MPGRGGARMDAGAGSELLPVPLCSVATYVLTSGGCAAARDWKTT